MALLTISPLPKLTFDMQFMCNPGGWFGPALRHVTLGGGNFLMTPLIIEVLIPRYCHDLKLHSSGRPQCSERGSSVHNQQEISWMISGKCYSYT